MSEVNGGKGMDGRDGRMGEDREEKVEMSGDKRVTEDGWREWMEKKRKKGKREGKRQKGDIECGETHSLLHGHTKKIRGRSSLFDITQPTRNGGC